MRPADSHSATSASRARSYASAEIA